MDRSITKPTVRVYEVQNDKLVLIGIVNKTTSVIWKRSWSTYGDFELHLGEPDDILKNGRFVMINDDERKFGIIEKGVDDSDGYQYNSTQDFTVYGYTADFILSQRISLPSDDDNKKHDGYMVWDNTPAETIMYDLVNKHVVNPTDKKRQIPLITLAKHGTPTEHKLSFQSRFKAITTDLNTLSINSGLGFECIPNFDTGKLVFTVLHGVDRTQKVETYKNGVESAKINPNAYIFSPDNKTVKKHTYTHDTSAYKNMAYVAGEGDGAKRKIVKVGDDFSGLNRREVLVDARDIQQKYTPETKTVSGRLSSGGDDEESSSSSSGDTKEATRTDAELTKLMQDRGNEKLQSEHRDVNSYEYQTFTTDYRVYWDLGDTCTYVDRANDVTLDQQVTAVEETYEDGDLTVEPTFGYTENSVTGAITSAQEAVVVERNGITKEFDKINTNVTNTNELFAKHAYIMGLDVDELTAKTLEAEMADFKTMSARRVSTQNLIANEANLTHLSSSRADIDDLTARTAEIKDLTAQTADIKDLTADKADILALTAQKAQLDDLVTKKATVDDLDANKATIDELIGNNANIKNLFANTATFDDATVGNLWSSLATIKTLLSNRIFAGSANIDTLTSEQLSAISGWITSAMIESLTADKITSGELDTSKVKIKSEDGGLVISGPTLQIADSNNTVRIQLGRDSNGNFTFVLYDTTGRGVLIDADGIKAASVPKGLIVNDMVADDASIAGSKLDIDSVIRVINSDRHLKAPDGTTILTPNGNYINYSSALINMTKIYLDEKNGTLSELLGKVDEDGGFATVNQLTQTSDSLTSTISKTMASVVPRYYQSGSETELTGGTWQDAVPAWTQGKYIWQKNVITYQSGTTKETTPVCIQGTKGEKGDIGTSVSKVVPEYYLSTSSTELAGGEWSETPAEYTEDHFYWMRTKVTYDSGAIAYSDAVLDTDLNDVRDVTDNLQEQQNKASDSITDIADDVSDLKDRATKNEEDIDANSDSVASVISTQTQFSQNLDGLSASVTTLQETTDAQGTTLETFTKWMDFDSTGLNIGDGKGANVNLSEKAMTFKNEAGQAVATFSDNVDIKNLVIEQGGIFTMGNFAFIPRSNGNLSIKYIGEA